MLLCIDSGNTRLKWGIHDGQSWVAQGALPQSELLRLAPSFPRDFPLKRALVANVAGDNVANVLRVMLPVAQGAIHFAESTAAAGGVRNDYLLPAQLGVDRWCALIGARQQVSGACLVVGAGTATTIDTLSAEGVFLGGLILPGLDLMRSALSSRTAQLPFAEGEWQAHPRRTQDAIFSGCIEAQVGAIARAFGKISASASAECLLFGGAASTLLPHLQLPLRVVEPLVLEGLRCLAGELS